MKRWSFFLVTFLLGGFVGAVEGDDWKAVFQKKEFRVGDTTLRYRVAEIGGGREGLRPLVLFLHGAGERGDDNESQLRHGMKDLVDWCVANKKFCVVVAPQCPKAEWWSTKNKDYKNPERYRLGEKDNEVTPVVLALVTHLVQEKKLSEDRLYLTGLSMGGYGTFALLARRPKLFAAAIPICGGGDVTTARAIKDVPLWVFHGDADSTVPVAMSRAMVQALEVAGGKPKYREYPGVGHNSWSSTYADPEVWAWLFAQKK
jgi:predicted peptidase